MKRHKLIKVTFEPDGAEVFVPAGTLLSKMAAAAGRAIETPCGGVGVCGKCRVIVKGSVSEPDTVERQRISAEDLADGVRLACHARVTGEVSITIPEESRSLVQKILSAGVLRECEVMSGVSKIACELPRSSLNDERADFERLADCLKSRDIQLRPNLNVVRKLSQLIRSSEYKVTAVISNDELIAVEPGDTSARCYGIAYDLGSTTIVGYLANLATGEELAVESAMNPQIVYGDDLVSRIAFATSHENGAQILQSAAVDALNRIAKELAETADIPIENIYKVTVVGNTCMTHLLLGIDVASLGQSPYVPSVCNDITVAACEIGLNISPQAKVTVLPNVAGFVGSDTVGVMLAGDWHIDKRTRLAVDIGTNGEMVLFANNRNYACSAAAGPAFEGAGISCGMRGAPGAIDSVKITDSVQLTTIEDKRPIGLCGSGLVDAVAQMLDAGIIDETGRLLPPEQIPNLPPAVMQRIIETDNGVEFVLAPGDESGNGKSISLKSSDIRHLQLAKGSIHAAMQTLLRIAEIGDCDLEEIQLAGAFGNYIRVDSAIRIGLIPPISRDKVKSVGNAAGAGSRLALLSEAEMELARQLARSAEHIELATSPHYQTELLERMMFPIEMAAC